MKADCTERLRRKSAGTCMYNTCTCMSDFIFQVEFQLESRKLCEKGKNAPEAELLLCGKDVLACERVDRIAPTSAAKSLSDV